MVKRELGRTTTQFRRYKEIQPIIVEKVVEHYKFELAKTKLIKMFFDEGKSVTQTCMEVGVCRATLFNWVKEIIELAEKWEKVLKEKK